MYIISNPKGVLFMTTKNTANEVWVLTADLAGNPSADIVGVYETKDACRKDFQDLLDSVWPSNWPNDRTVDDNGNDKAECLEDLLFCDDGNRNYLEGQPFTVQKG